MIRKFIFNSVNALLSNSQVDFSQEFIIPFRVYPNDLDLNLHMNNGRFLSHMDTGKIDFLIRTGIAKRAVKLRAKPVTAAVKISYFKDLKIFEKYQLRTKLIGIDNRWLYFQQTFKKNNGKTIAHALVKLGFSSNGLLPIKNILSDEEVAKHKIENIDEYSLLKNYEEYVLKFR